MVVVLRIIHVEVGLRLNVKNKFQNQRRLSSRLATVMFCGTPCTSSGIQIECTIRRFIDEGYKEIVALSYSTNIKYAVRFRSK